MKQSLLKYILAQALAREPGIQPHDLVSFMHRWNEHVGTGEMTPEAFCEWMLVKVHLNLHHLATKLGHAKGSGSHWRTTTRGMMRALTQIRNIDMGDFL